ncbi:MAG: RdgB/HAM1 family non-canonical purine NTP pyrophosphatase [Labilithrix sp.]|nr:RdgB/HAM1 family non-canonical purine NTP pyrophosphatase [Labilithrix sp.]MBX3225018.1 RdgB/HAM1 family non-canonical purine NTP pyrophosphatase [Labilithrix sp.]
MKHSLVVATNNRGKLEELRHLLADMSVEVLSIQDVSKKPIHVVEDGDTFEANAIKKAREVAAATMMLTLADDSGLEVDALGGAPGVRSARFAGERATDAENNAALLAALDELTIDAAGTRTSDINARFRCVLALVDPFVNDGEPRVVEGTCAGKITRTPRGSGGFGYDPLFLVDGADKTMAELSEDEKNRVSHRALAARGLRKLLEDTIAARDALTRDVVG